MVERARVSVRDRIRRMVIENPVEIDADKILAKLNPKGDRKAEMPSRFMVESLRNDTRQTLRLLKDLGYLTDGYLDRVRM